MIHSDHNAAYLIVLHSLQKKLIRAIDDKNQHIFHPDPSPDFQALDNWINHYKKQIKEHEKNNAQTSLI